jgi:hypothetical protein
MNTAFNAATGKSRLVVDIRPASTARAAAKSSGKQATYGWSRAGRFMWHIK